MVAEIVNNCWVAHATVKRKLDFISNVKNVIDGEEWQKMQKEEGENKCMKGFQALIKYITKPIHFSTLMDVRDAVFHRKISLKLRFLLLKKVIAPEQFPNFP